MAEFEKIVVITRKTALEELIERFNTREQARFYIEHLGASFEEYQAAHDTYHAGLNTLKRAVPHSVRTQFIERSFLPTFTFGDHDLAIALGPDGLVVNTAKYLSGQPLLAFNPDPQRIDGVLLPFRIDWAGAILPRVLQGHFSLKRISMAKAQLSDNQTLYAVNDLFIGQASHVSARYRLRLGRQTEDQSSSGIIVSTGAGSTGWLRSIVTGAARVVAAINKTQPTEIAVDDCRFDWEAEALHYSVREPFVSKVSGAQMVFGRVEAQEKLEITSQMPQNGVIFSDGIEDDYLTFNSGTVANIRVAEKKVHLIV
jgi:NAD kinase